MSIPPIVDLKHVIYQKTLMMYPTHVAYRVDIPGGESVEAYLEVPNGFDFIVTGEIHDVPVDTFTHECEKDGFKVIPETLIDGTSEVLAYPAPILVENYWRGVVRNITDTTQTFRLRVPFLCSPVGSIEIIRKEVTFEKEVMAAIRSVWMKLAEEGRLKLIEAWMAESPALLAALAR